MSPATTRHTARRRLKATLPAEEEHDEGASSSSEEDEEGIPARQSPPKYQRSPHGPTLRPMRTKRSRDGEPLRNAIISKKLKMNELAIIPSRPLSASSGHQNGYMTPRSSRIAHEAADIASQGGTERASIDEDVADEMVNILNNVCGPNVTLDSPGQQLRDELAQDAEEHKHEVSDLDIGDHDSVDADSEPQEPELEDNDLSVEPKGRRAEEIFQGDEVPESPQHSDVEDGPRNDALSHDAEDIREAYDATVEHGGDEYRPPSEAPHYDIYEVPNSPQMKTAGGRLGASTLSRPSPVRPRSPGLRKSRKRFTRAQELELRRRNHGQNQVKEVAIQGLEGEAVEDEPLLPELPRQPQRNAIPPAVDRNEDPNQDSECDLEFSSDLDAEDDIQTAFANDVQKLGANPDRHEGDSLFFDAAVDDNHITIPLPPKEYLRSSGLMRRLGWTGILQDWETKLLETHQPKTTVGRYLVLYLQKLERCIVVTPQAPRFAEQNRFLHEHSGLLEYSFCKIEEGIEHIRSKSLSFTRRTAHLNRNRKRQNVTWDLVRLVIPLFIRVLGKAWALGGDESSFTVSTVQLLTRLVGWVANMYAMLRRELERRPFEKEPEPNYRKAVWQKAIDMRNKLRLHLARLRDILEHAPSDLEREEQRQAREKVDRQRKLERQKEIEMELELKAAAKKEAQRAQNLRVVRAIRGGATKGGVPSTPTPRVARPPSEVEAPWLSWREEEEECLCKKLQQAFEYDPPRLPDLATTATVIGHSPRETQDKARDLLSLMLSKAYPERTGREIQSEIQQLMRQWA